MAVTITVKQHDETGLFIDQAGRVFKELRTQDRGGVSSRIPYKHINHKGKKYDCHRLVGQTYIPNPEDKPCVMHLDDNPQNNNVLNLQWGTYKENMQDMMRKGRHTASGPQGPAKRLNKYEEVLELLLQGHTQRHIGELLNVTEGRISQMVREMIKWNWIAKRQDSKYNKL